MKSILPTWSAGLLIIIIEFFFVFAAMSGSYTLMIILTILALGTLILYSALYNRLHVSFNNFTILLGIFLIYFLIRAIATGSTTDIYFYVFGFLFILFFTSCEKDLIMENLWKFLIALGVFFAIGVILQFLFTDLFMDYYTPLFADSYKTSIRRQILYDNMYTGWTSQTFATSINLILGLFATWSLWHKKKKRMYIVYAVIMMIAFLLTGKRGALIFMLLAFVLIELWTAENAKVFLNKFGRYIAIAFVVLVLIFAFEGVLSSGSLGSNTITRLLNSFNSLDDSDVSNGRFSLWAYALNLFGENPAFGIGWEQFQVSALHHFGTSIEVHNIYLQLLTETGFIGLILYLIPILYALIDTKQKCVLSRKMGFGDISNSLKFSLMLQAFLFLYGFTGNVLYDYNALLMYFLAFGIYLSVSRSLNFSLSVKHAREFPELNQSLRQNMVDNGT